MIGLAKAEANPFACAEPKEEEQITTSRAQMQQLHLLLFGCVGSMWSLCGLYGNRPKE